MTESFTLVQLEPDEHVVFGISLETSHSIYSTNETRRGITNKRVVIEGSTGRTMSIANSEVKTVTLARDRRMGVEYLRIVSIKDGSGRTHRLGFGGLDSGLEPRLQAMFPRAKVAIRKKRSPGNDLRIASLEQRGG